VMKIHSYLSYIVHRLTPWDNNFWIDINYLDAARAAQYCGAYLTSILFIEIYSVDYES